MKQFLYISAFLVLILSCKKEEISVLSNELQTGTTERINDLFFVNDSLGFAVGGERYQNGMILRTTNGGLDWEVTNDLAPVTFFGVHFLNENVGQAVGYGGNIAHTVDGGVTWDVINYHSYERINDVFLTDSTAFMAGGDGYKDGVAIRSTSEWYFFNETFFEPSWLAITFTSPNTGYLAGYGAMAKTTNAGDDWSFLDIRGDFYSDISFPTKDVGYVCGLQGSIQKTTDAGLTWEKQLSVNGAFGKRIHLESIHFYNSEIGITVGYDGKIYYTNNGGTDWREVNLETPTNFRAALMTSTNTALVAGDNGKMFSLRF